LGFDWIYDKRVTDSLMERDASGLQRLVQSRSQDYLERSVHFLENHDEPRVADRLTPVEHRAAAWLILGLPGVPLLHEGQLEGARWRASVHLNRRLPETTDETVAQFYRQFLGTLRESNVRHGKGVVLRPEAATDSDAKDLLERIMVVAWSGCTTEPLVGWDIVVANPSNSAGKCRVLLPGLVASQQSWRVCDRLAPSGTWPRQFNGAELILEVPAFATQLLEVRPV
jgi:hypothetical protein